MVSQPEPLSPSQSPMAGALTDLLLPFQKKWIADSATFKIAEKGRQLGFTWIEALWSVLRRLETRIDHYFVSADEEQAKQFIRDCLFWCETLNKVASVTHSTALIDTGKAQVSRLTFPNGSQILSLSSNPKAIRGKRGDVTLDEFAFHDNADEMYRAAEACRRWGDGKESGQIHILSTHNGPATLYFKIVDQARKGENDFVLHRVTLLDAVAEGLADRVPGNHQKQFCPGSARNQSFITTQRRACSNEEHYKQEHLCEPLSASALVSPYRYDLCKQGALFAETFDDSRKYGELFCGVDVGRSHDLTAIWVIERGYLDPAKFPDVLDEHRGVYRTVSLTVLRNEDIPHQYRTLRRILLHPSMSKCCIDMGMVGRALSDMAVDEFGWLVEPTAMGRPMKEESAERVKQFIEQKRVGVPADNRVRDDICSMRRVIVSNREGHVGSLSYEGSTRDSHCDRFWALALALHAAEAGQSVVLSTGPNHIPNTRARALTGAV